MATSSSNQRPSSTATTATRSEPASQAKPKLAALISETLTTISKAKSSPSIRAKTTALLESENTIRELDRQLRKHYALGKKHQQDLEKLKTEHEEAIKKLRTEHEEDLARTKKRAEWITKTREVEKAELLRYREEKKALMEEVEKLRKENAELRDPKGGQNDEPVEAAERKAESPQGANDGDSGRELTPRQALLVDLIEEATSAVDKKRKRAANAVDDKEDSGEERKVKRSRKVPEA